MAVSITCSLIFGTSTLLVILPATSLALNMVRAKIKSIHSGQAVARKAVESAIKELENIRDYEALV
ncbi:MAG: hypothetical protein JSU69_11425 [Candidatus Zixiibacteriota bacterium]|nr:MAG: hypothetical protein JSU69_11425 [candidate division Zixibacteria bacterium]